MQQRSGEGGRKFGLNSKGKSVGGKSRVRINAPSSTASLGFRGIGSYNKEGILETTKVMAFVCCAFDTSDREYWELQQRWRSGDSKD